MRSKHHRDFHSTVVPRNVFQKCQSEFWRNASKVGSLSPTQHQLKSFTIYSATGQKRMDCGLFGVALVLGASAQVLEKCAELTHTATVTSASLSRARPAGSILDEVVNIAEPRTDGGRLSCRIRDRR